jgi:hypothetical protein
MTVNCLKEKLMLFVHQLKAEGITEGRAHDLASAVMVIHNALCKLDPKNLDMFMKKGLAGRTSEYARLLGMNDVTMTAIARKVKELYIHIDQTEINLTTWTDEVYAHLEPLAELGFPGVSTTLVALRMLRRLHEGIDDLNNIGFEGVSHEE